MRVNRVRIKKKNDGEKHNVESHMYCWHKLTPLISSVIEATMHNAPRVPA